MNVAPSLHEAQQALIKQQNQDLLSQHLLHRPAPDSPCVQTAMVNEQVELPDTGSVGEETCTSTEEKSS